MEIYPKVNHVVDNSCVAVENEFMALPKSFVIETYCLGKAVDKWKKVARLRLSVYFNQEIALFSIQLKAIRWSCILLFGFRVHILNHVRNEMVFQTPHSVQRTV